MDDFEAIDWCLFGNFLSLLHCCTVRKAYTDNNLGIIYVGFIAALWPKTIFAMLFIDVIYSIALPVVHPSHHLPIVFFLYFVFASCVLFKNTYFCRFFPSVLWSATGERRAMHSGCCAYVHMWTMDKRFCWCCAPAIHAALVAASIPTYYVHFPSLSLSKLFRVNMVFVRCHLQKLIKLMGHAKRSSSANYFNRYRCTSDPVYVCKRMSAIEIAYYIFCFIRNIWKWNGRNHKTAADCCAWYIFYFIIHVCVVFYIYTIYIHVVIFATLIFYHCDFYFVTVCRFVCDCENYVARDRMQTITNTYNIRHMQ